MDQNQTLVCIIKFSTYLSYRIQRAQYRNIKNADIDIENVEGVI